MSEKKAPPKEYPEPYLTWQREQRKKVKENKEEKK